MIDSKIVASLDVFCSQFMLPVVDSYKGATNAPFAVVSDYAADETVAPHTKGVGRSIVTCIARPRSWEIVAELSRVAIRIIESN